MKAINQLEQMKDRLDKIAVNTEVLENLNKLTTDKLDQIGDLDLGLSYNELLSQLREITRYNECYMTLAYIMSEEIEKLNDNVNSIYDEINDILTTYNKKDIKSE